jgi:hypothetical protein
MIIGALLILLIFMWNILGVKLLGAFIMQSERIGFYELSVMINCRYNPQKDLNLLIGNENFIIPLPQNSARFENVVYPVKEGSSQFITSITDLEDYFRSLSKGGWIIKEQMGASYTIENLNIDKQFHIIINKFTRYYYRLNYF